MTEIFNEEQNFVLYPRIKYFHIEGEDKKTKRTYITQKIIIDLAKLNREKFESFEDARRIK